MKKGSILVIKKNNEKHLRVVTIDDGQEMIDLFELTELKKLLEKL